MCEKYVLPKRIINSEVFLRKDIFNKGTKAIVGIKKGKG